VPAQPGFRGHARDPQERDEITVIVTA
jgi:hypothetical protein